MCPWLTLKYLKILPQEVIPVRKLILLSLTASQLSTPRGEGTSISPRFQQRLSSANAPALNSLPD